MKQLANPLHNQEVGEVPPPDSALFGAHPRCFGSATAGQHGLIQRTHTFLPLSVAETHHTNVASKNVVIVFLLAGALTLFCLQASCIQAIHISFSSTRQQPQAESSQMTAIPKEHHGGGFFLSSSPQVPHINNWAPTQHANAPAAAPQYASLTSFKVEEAVDIPVDVNGKWMPSEKEAKNGGDAGENSFLEDGTEVNWTHSWETLPHIEISDDTMQLLVDSKVLHHYPLWAIHRVQERFPNLPIDKLGHPEQLAQGFTDLSWLDDKKQKNEHGEAEFLKEKKSEPEAALLLEKESIINDNNDNELQLMKKLEEPEKPLKEVTMLLSGDSSEWTKQECKDWLEVEKFVNHQASLMAVAENGKEECNTISTNKSSKSRMKKIKHKLTAFMSKLKKKKSLERNVIDNAKIKVADWCANPPEEIQREKKKGLKERIKAAGKAHGKAMISRAMSSLIAKKLKPVFKEIRALVKKLLDFWKKHGDAIMVLVNLVVLVANFSAATGGIGGIILLGLGVLGFAVHLVHTIMLYRNRKNAQHAFERQIAFDITYEQMHEEVIEEDRQLKGKELLHQEGRAGVVILAKMENFIQEHKVGKALKKLFQKLEKFVIYLGELFFRILKLVFKPILKVLRPMLQRLPGAHKLAQLLSPADKLSKTVSSIVTLVSKGTKATLVINAVLNGVSNPTSLLIPLFSLFSGLAKIAQNVKNTQSMNLMAEDLTVISEKQCANEKNSKARENCMLKAKDTVKYVVTQCQSDLNEDFAEQIAKLARAKASESEEDLRKRQTATLKKLAENEPDEKKRTMMKQKLADMGLFDKDQAESPPSAKASDPPKSSCTAERHVLEKIRNKEYDAVSGEKTET